jgi:NCAIR mutase (PurE)-related protein
VRPAELKRLLGRVRRGTLSPADAARAIGAAPVETLEFATLDHQRALRVGFPEVIFGLGKTPKQVLAIATRLAARHPVILATRLEPEAQ